jgi:transcriptional regulator with XRE-family HTH domain
MKNYQSLESIDMTDFLDQVLKETPKESVLFIEKSLAIINQIFNILERKNLKQKDLASLLGKSEAEISKWLGGTHNLTLRTISKIEAVLGEDIIEIPNKIRDGFILENSIHSKVIKFTPSINRQEKKEEFKELKSPYEVIIPCTDYRKAS